VVTEKRHLGDFGERVASHKLESLGMRIVARNVRIGRAEIDLVAEDGDDLVFVEVRTRRGSAGMAAESITPAKLRTMWACVFGYCEANGIATERARVDLVAVDLDGHGTARSVEHFRALDSPPEE
jgi:putative endonuclease